MGHHGSCPLHVTPIKINSMLAPGDLHCPANHIDSPDFVNELVCKFKFDLVVYVGDETDQHAINFHGANSDLPSHGPELEKAIMCLKDFYVVTPKAKILESNHGSMIMRRIKHHGISMRVLRPIEQILEAPKGWEWREEIWLKLPDGSLVNMVHGKSSVPTGLSKRIFANYGVMAHTMEGHFHTKSQIDYWGAPHNRRWGMYVGCLIDNTALNFLYNKLQLDPPALSCGGILDGEPVIFPMVLDKRGRWDKKIRVLRG